jgi:NRAMP (natural resistance-associated macrophage protein)-like metal ion transporter
MALKFMSSTGADLSPPGTPQSVTPQAQRVPGRLAVGVRRVTHSHPLDRLRGLRNIRRWRPLAVLGFLGPGLIAANAGNDAGGIATYSTVGAQYGYGLLWMLVIITVSLMVVQEMCARMGAATGKGLSDLIRERFGVRGATTAMLILLIANTLTTISEFAGVAAALELFGVTKYISVPIAAVAVWLLLTRGSYERVEKIFLVMTFAFFAYPIAAFLAHPNWADVVRHTVIPNFQWQTTYLLLFVGTVGTTITPYMQLYIQSSVAEKGVTMERYALERADAYFGSIFSDIIAGFIIVACGATIFATSGGKGVVINTADQAARALAPLLGPYAPYLFGVGLLGASLLAAAVLPLSTTYAICESFGFEHGVSYTFREAPVFQTLFTGMIVLGALVALIPGLPLIQLLVIVQVINGVLLPILLVFILLLVNDRRIMGRYVNGLGKNIIAIGTTALLSFLCVVMILSIVLPVFGIPFLQ